MIPIYFHWTKIPYSNNKQKHETIWHQPITRQKIDVIAWKSEHWSREDGPSGRTNQIKDNVTRNQWKCSDLNEKDDPCRTSDPWTDLLLRLNTESSGTIISRETLQISFDMSSPRPCLIHALFTQGFTRLECPLSLRHVRVTLRHSQRVLQRACALSPAK